MRVEGRGKLKRQLGSCAGVRIVRSSDDGLVQGVCKSVDTQYNASVICSGMEENEPVCKRS